MTFQSLIRKRTLENPVESLKDPECAARLIEIAVTMKDPKAIALALLEIAIANNVKLEQYFNGI